MTVDRRRFLTAPVAPLAIGALATLSSSLFANLHAQESKSQDGKPQDGAPGSDLAVKLAFPKIVVLVRHAERSDEPKGDPVLNEVGVQRAERLAGLLKKSGVTHLIASEYQRTQQTLAPLALAANVRVQIAKAVDPNAAKSAIDSLPRGSLIVIAGHSNTIPALANLLTGGNAEIKMDETEFDRLLLVTEWGPGKQSTLLELRY
jgi:phosphohistidine phosphatase SixA